MEVDNVICEKFLSICIPGSELLGAPTIYSILNSLPTTTDNVPSLVKLSLLNLVKRGLADPKRKKKLVKLVKTTFPFFFSPLVFGDCAPISAFILEHTPNDPIVNPIMDPHVFMSLEPMKTMLALSADQFYEEEHAKNQIPYKKVYQLLPALYKRPLKVVTFMIHNDLPDANKLVEKLIQVKNESGCPLKEAQPKVTEDFIYLYFFN